jgi:hypothetical protein
MRARVRVALRLASKAGQTTDTLQGYYQRLRAKRPVPTELYAEDGTDCSAAAISRAGWQS